MSDFSNLIENFIKNDENELFINKHLNKNQRKYAYELIESNNLYYRNIFIGKQKYIIILKNKDMDLTFYNEVSIKSPDLNCINQFLYDYKHCISNLDYDFIIYSCKKLDPYFDTWKCYKDIFYPIINKLGNGNINLGLNIHRNLISNLFKTIVDTISNNDIYKKFIKLRFDNKINIPKKNLYSIFNANKYEHDIKNKNNLKYYISIDFKSANYNVCKYYNNEIVINSESWSHLLSMLILNDPLRVKECDDLYIQYFKTNKHFRQIVFGSLNCKKIMEYSKSLINILCKNLIDSNLIDIKDILSVSSDEIILISSDDYINTISKIIQFTKESDLKLYEICKFQAFNLYHLNYNNYYVKSIIYDNDTDIRVNSDKISFKCINNKYINQCIAYYENIEICKNDLKFDVDGIPAYFEKSIFN